MQRSAIVAVDRRRERCGEVFRVAEGAALPRKVEERARPTHEQEELDPRVEVAAIEWRLVRRGPGGQRHTELQRVVRLVGGLDQLDHLAHTLGDSRVSALGLAATAAGLIAEALASPRTAPLAGSCDHVLRLLERCLGIGVVACNGIARHRQSSRVVAVRFDRRLLPSRAGVIRLPRGRCLGAAGIPVDARKQRLLHSSPDVRVQPPLSRIRIGVIEVGRKEPEILVSKVRRVIGQKMETQSQLPI